MMWLGVVLLAIVPSDSVRVISLDQALDLAQTYAPQAVSAAGQLRTSAAGVRSAYAAFLPNVSLNSGATRQYPSGGGTRIENGQVIQVPATPWSYNGSLSANVELFGGGDRIFALGQAKADRRSAEAGGVISRYAVALSVKQQYFNVLAARESKAAAQAQVDQAEQQLTTSIVRVRNQAATRSDSLRSVIQLNTARLAVLTAQNNLDVANASLTRAVGTPYPVTAAGDPPEFDALSTDEATLARMAEQGPGVRQAQAQLDAAKAARRITWTRYLPSVNASYSRSASGTNENFALGADDYSYNGSLRFSLSLPIFNQLQREEQVVRSQVAVENAEAGLHDARLAATQGLTQSLGDYRLNLERVSSLTASLEAAQEDLRVQQQRYAVGGSTLLDVLTSQTQLNQARQDLIRARFDLRVARAQLEAVIGEDL